jgi:hypothetical protein
VLANRFRPFTAGQRKKLTSNGSSYFCNLLVNLMLAALLVNLTAALLVNLTAARLVRYKLLFLLSSTFQPRFFIFIQTWTLDFFSRNIDPIDPPPHSVAFYSLPFPPRNFIAGFSSC